MSAAGNDIYTWDVETGHHLRGRLKCPCWKCLLSGTQSFWPFADGAIHIFEDRPLRRVTSHSSDVVISNIKPVASWVPHSRPVYSPAWKEQ